MSSVAVVFSGITNRTNLSRLGFVDQGSNFWLERLDIYVSKMVVDSTPYDTFYQDVLALMRENNAEWER